MRFWGRKKEELPEKTAPKLRHRYKVGLALSGGGAKGIAHVGVIRAFEETGLDFDFVAGTSVGSLVGAAYCAGISWEEMAEFCRSVKEKEIRNSRSVFFPSESRNIERLAYRLLGGKNFNELNTLRLQRRQFGDGRGKDFYARQSCQGNQCELFGSRHFFGS